MLGKIIYYHNHNHKYIFIFQQAFATIAVIEALIHRVRGLKWFLSEQMLIDCDTLNGGCNGK